MTYLDYTTKIWLEFEPSDTGLVGTIGVEVLDEDGATIDARSVTGVEEKSAIFDGLYLWSKNFSSETYSNRQNIVIKADNGSGSDIYATLQLFTR